MSAITITISIKLKPLACRLRCPPFVLMLLINISRTSGSPFRQTKAWKHRVTGIGQLNIFGDPLGIAAPTPV
jgi:hypothetical protein